VVLDNPRIAKRRVAIGSYAGDDADDVQVVTGFKCCLVVILATGAHCAIMVPGMAQNGTVALAGGTAIHATDGFVTFTTGDGVRTAGWTYYWMALEAD